ncbi:transposase, partial [Caldibacillus thermoamylovorans]|nr:transposase [Caldibacillus thermoamylovorans]
MIKKLFKKRCFESYRINGKYWGIAIDGTGIFTFDKKHCEHCLKREHKYIDKETGEEKIKTIYMHHVLEAKLIVGNMVLSVASEFIENESENVKKQDCELKAFYRLTARLKDTFKKLPICLIADSLYACENV